MKTTKIVLGIFCLLAIMSHAQKKEIDCNFNMNRAVFHLEGNELFKKDKQKAIEYLIPCVEAKDPLAQLIMGRILLNSNNENKHHRAFKLIKASAKQNNPIAAADLGILYKYGKGCALNYNKARKWFKIAVELGNDKAAYTLGYLYLKGFGNIKQNYTKAVSWFQKSDYPMAKYWLGVCYYYGYGVNKNITKANELLRTNFKEEVKNYQTTNAENIASTSKEIIKEENIFLNSQNITPKKLNGTWKGDLLFFDWSGNNIENKVSFEIVFNHNKENNILKVKINDQEQKVNFTQIANSLYFEEFTTKLPHTSFIKEIPSKLTHQILSSTLSLKSLKSGEYLTGSIETHVSEWNERGVPISFVVKKDVKFKNSNEKLSNEAMAALSKQENSFIKLYPNPFENDLIISYSLNQKQSTKVMITNFNNFKEVVVKPVSIQEPGTYQYFFDGVNLPKGKYIVIVDTGKGRKTRIIIKK
ncbi:T9SS type A sorting domain-containing protein [uncultured Tenacibaculum sp.]|uniref:T9SS type A sorting domain-containing protein n=1 Tax=uncultured Tenacibaculum sp. TaxID=174713 RepID=UPI00262BA7C3|nr:T9SS type A sorting domain-containing protein [uncultured Tenacibaculum sp.]